MLGIFWKTKNKAFLLISINKVAVKCHLIPKLRHFVHFRKKKKLDYNLYP